MPFFERRLPPLESVAMVFEEEEEEAEHPEGLSRSRSYPGFFPYGFVVAELRQQEEASGAEEKDAVMARNCEKLASVPFSPKRLWPNTNEEKEEEERQEDISPGENYWQPSPAVLAQESEDFLEMRCPTCGPTCVAVVEMKSIVQHQQQRPHRSLVCQEDTAWPAEDPSTAMAHSFTRHARSPAMQRPTSYNREVVQERPPVVLHLEAFLAPQEAMQAPRMANAVVRFSPQLPKQQQAAFRAGSCFFPDNNLPVVDTSVRSKKKGSISEARRAGMKALQKARAFLPAMGQVDLDGPKHSELQQASSQALQVPTLLGCKAIVPGNTQRRAAVGKSQQVPKMDAMLVAGRSQSFFP
jgi:hypothetical protein